VDVLHADPAMGGGPPTGADRIVAWPAGEPAEALDVDLDDLARLGRDERAADRPRGREELPEAMHPEPPQDPVRRPPRDPGHRPDPIRTPAPLPARGQERGLALEARPPWRVVRTARAIGELPGATAPAIHGVPTDADVSRGLGHADAIGFGHEKGAHPGIEATALVQRRPSD
jgi:hypothetical protein